jgi:hypothetical protein
MQFRTTTRRGIGLEQNPQSVPHLPRWAPAGDPPARYALLAGLFCIAAFLLLDGAAQAKPRRAPAKSPAPSVCKVDGDCALVVDGCCSCTEGGKQRAVPVAARTSYESRRKAVCRQTMCPALMSEDASCLASHAVCKDGACALGSN